MAYRLSILILSGALVGGTWSDGRSPLSDARKVADLSVDRRTSADFGHRGRDSVTGITFAIDSGRDGGAASGVFRTFEGVVTVVAGRGRLDIVAMGRGAEIRALGVGFIPPQAQAGDYYLFDSTGFVLVRPRSKSFSSFAFLADEYHYDANRGSWPSGIAATTPVVIDTAQPGGRRPMQHGEAAVYWQLGGERDPSRGGRSAADARTDGMVATGRVVISDVPPGEVGVARWFAPSQALATLPGTSLPRTIRLTTFATFTSFRMPSEARAAAVFGSEYTIAGPKQTEVDRSRLLLPEDFVETDWPAWAGIPGLPAKSRDAGAKWRKLP
jgi:hypothetical protein